MVKPSKCDAMIISLITALILLVFISIILFINDWDPKTFIFKGSVYQHNEPSGTIGYDGQFAYYIAFNPITAVDKIDNASYRYQRILYPIMAWLLSFGGNPTLLPWVLLIINLVSLSVGSGLLATIFQSRGVPVWYAFAFIAFGGVLISLRADLNELLAVSLALIGLIFAYREQWVFAGLLFSLAILSKEITIIFPLSISLWLLIKKRVRIAIVLGCISILPAILWGIFISNWLGNSPLNTAAARLELIPFIGLKSIMLSSFGIYISFCGLHCLQLF